MCHLPTAWTKRTFKVLAASVWAPHLVSCRLAIKLKNLPSGGFGCNCELVSGRIRGYEAPAESNSFADRNQGHSTGESPLGHWGGGRDANQHIGTDRLPKHLAIVQRRFSHRLCASQLPEISSPQAVSLSEQVLRRGGVMLNPSVPHENRGCSRRTLPRTMIRSQGRSRRPMHSEIRLNASLESQSPGIEFESS